MSASKTASQGGGLDRIALAQLNPVLGAFKANADRIVEHMASAAAAGAQLLLTPAHGLSGAPLAELLLRPALHRQLEDELARIAAASVAIDVIVSHPQLVDGRCLSALSLYGGGRLRQRRYKRVLASDRHLAEIGVLAADDAPLQGFSIAGEEVLVLCGEEFDAPALHDEITRLCRAGVRTVLLAEATPYVAGAPALQRAARSARAAALELTLLSAALCGAQDEVIFAGGSTAITATGELTHQAALFEPQLGLLQRQQDGGWVGGLAPWPDCEEAEIYQALCCGVADFFAKNGFRQALIGFSGGIDSALVLAIAVDALGAEQVRAVMLNSPYTAQMSLDDSRDMVARLGVRYEEIAIAPAMQAFDAMLDGALGGQPAGVTAENLQSRIRGTALMAMANAGGAVVLITSNKSEMATGYCTLYGDMAGALAVLKDVYKTQVFRLARWRNTRGEVIPPNIISRPPSAELRPEQLDSDSLPDYEVLDALIRGHVEDDLDAAALTDKSGQDGKGLAGEALTATLALIRRNEYKRSQAPQGLRVSARSFGRDRLYPITSSYQD